VCPASVAVVGASERSGHFGNQPLVNLRRFGFTGDVYPVNPQHQVVEGWPCFPSVTDLPAVPDLAVIAVRRDLCTKALEECAGRGIPAAIVVASGFAETGDADDISYQGELVKIAARTGIRVCGPNTLGIANFNNSVVPFASGNLPPSALAGPIAVVSQSGGCGFTLVNRAWSLGVGIGHLAVAGNESDVTIPELISYYLDQDDIRVVLCYMEAIRDAAGLRDVARQSHECGKPIFVFKAGTTAAGQRAAAAHTGALATSDVTLDAALAQWGIGRAHTFDVLLAAGALAARFDPPTSSRLGIYAQGGGMSVVTSDMFTDRGLILPSLEPSTVHRLKELMADTTPGNPFDSGGQFLSSGVELLVEALHTFTEDPNLDFIVYCLMPVAGLRTKVYAEGIARASKASDKPSMVMHYRAGEITAEASEIFDDAGLLVFDPPEAAIDGVALWLAGARRAASKAVDCRVDEHRAAQARSLVEGWREGSVKTVSQGASQDLLDLYDITHGRWTLARTAEQAAQTVGSFGVLVAMKVESFDLPHRSDFGGVILNVADPDQASKVFDTLIERARATDPAARIDGVLVAEMARPGVELIGGISVDPALGPAVLIGMGGVMAEIFNDVSIRLPPLDEELAEEMLRSLKSAPVLFGHRGASGVDIAAATSFLVRLGEMATDLGHLVTAVDLNPVVVRAPGEGLEVLDVLVEIAP